MTTLRKKKEFKKSLKKENNKTSKKKLRKRSKNKISKKRLLAGSKIGGKYSPATDRNIRVGRISKDLTEALTKIGNKMVEDLKNKYKLNLCSRINETNNGIYLNINFTNQAFPSEGRRYERQLLHLSDHNGVSNSLDGAIHIKQLYTFNREPIGPMIQRRDGILEPQGRYFKIVYSKDDSGYLNGGLTLQPQVELENEPDFIYLKNFIEQLDKETCFQGLGLYPPIRHHHFTPPRESNPNEPSSTDVENGSGEKTKDPPYINNIYGIKPRELFNFYDFPSLGSK